MLIQEARWFASQLEDHTNAELAPLLNVGSSTGYFRRVQQPWIEQEIFAPLERRGVEVWHLDLKQGEGVTLVGDLIDPTFRATVVAAGPRAAFCSNLLEHVPQRDALAAAIVEVLPAGALIFASCPYRYPYHPDPVDTGFRPTPHELAALFPGCDLLHHEIVTGNTFWDQLDRRLLPMAKLIFRMAIPIYKPKSWLSILAHVPWLRRPFQASGVVLRTPPS